MNYNWRMPETTGWAKEQNLHEATLEYGNELYEIVKEHGFHKGDLAIEIGCAWGVSALAILMAGKGDLLSVDSNEGNHAIEEVQLNGYGHRWQFHHCKSEDYWRQNELQFDIVYIDGSHKYPTCEDDLQQGFHFLKPGGILIADDYRHPKNQETELDGSVEYGVSYGVCNFLFDNQVTKIATTSHFLVAYK